MLGKAIQKLSRTVTGGAFIIGVASIVSRAIGLVRDNLLAKYFGASATLDIYNAAFKVPDLLFNILVLGALSASFIPVFIETKQKEGEAKAFQLTNTVLHLIIVSVTVAAVIGIAVSPYVAQWLMADRSALDQQHTADLMRIMLISVVFFAVSNVWSGVLNSFRRFAVYSLAPILYNAGIIVGIVVFYPLYGIHGLAYGVVLGSAMHMLVQLPAVIKLGYRYTPQFNWNEPGVRKILKLMPPRALALGIVQINALIIAAFALRLEEGSLAVWTWADNLQHFPINVFGVSLALSSFPVFSQAFAEQDMARFKQVFSENFRRILFLIIPISIGVLLLRAQIVRLVLGSFGAGAFDWEATILTAKVLGLFAISMFAQATIPLLARSFFAKHDTTTPVIVSIATMLLNIILAWFISNTMGIYGLALAFSISSLFNMLLLLIVLRVEFGDLDDKTIVRTIWNVMAAALVMGLVVQGMKYFVAPLVDMRTVVGLFTQTVISAGAGATVYIAIALYFKFDEVEIVGNYLHKLKRVWDRLLQS